jgi:galactokinase
MSRILEKFEAHYGVPATVLSAAPGRLEVLGNHTDYNDGIVLSMAVEQVTEFAMTPIEGDICRIKDFRDNSETSFNLNDISTPVPKDWGNYIKGVIVELRQRGFEIKAFDAAILSTIPLSAGMSSSAALEVAAGYAFSEAFDIQLSKKEWAEIGQGVENNYMGLKSGLLDQFSSIFGEKNSLIYSDFRTNEVIETVRLPEEYIIVVANSMVKHNLVDSAYNQRHESCKNIVKILKEKYSEISALRDVSLELLEKEKSSFPVMDYRCALHVVGEMARVKAGVKALKNGDITTFGKILFESHKSSKDNFDNSCSELDYLVELAKTFPEAIGARLSGGGFGGISIHLVKQADADVYCELIKTAFMQQTGKESEIIQCAIGNGASVKKV